MCVDFFFKHYYKYIEIFQLYNYSNGNSGTSASRLSAALFAASLCWNMEINYADKTHHEVIHSLTHSF